MPISLGKHVKQVGAHVRGVGRHTAVVKTHYDVRQIALCALLAIAVIVLPFSFNRLLVVVDEHALAESAPAVSAPASPGASSASVVASASEMSVQADALRSFIVPPEAFVQETLEASDIVTDMAPATFTDHVQAQSQNEIMAGGCELVSLGIVLDAMGLDADIHYLVAEHLTQDGHFATGYSGDPYHMGGGYPQGIVEAANRYLLELGSSYQAHNLTDKSFELVKALIAQGYPVLVWTTMGFEDPHFTGAFDNGVEWYSNEHCVVVYGVNEESVLVSDPLEGLVERDLQRFVEIYEACGSMAVAIY